MASQLFDRECKDDQQSQWEKVNFDPLQTLNPLNRSSPNLTREWHTWLRRGYRSTKTFLYNPL